MTMERKEGQIVLIAFPSADYSKPKFRPAMLLRSLPGNHGDWLLCLVSTKLYQTIEGFDEVIEESDPDFKESGLKQKSLVRISRLAVVNEILLPGAIGSVSIERTERVRGQLADWLLSGPVKTTRSSNKPSAD